MNSIAYVGRSSFRIEEVVPEDDEAGEVFVPMDSLVTARIGLRAPVHFTAPQPPLDESEMRLLRGKWPLRLPAWALGGLGLIAFAAGLTVAGAIQRSGRAEAGAAQATTAELAPTPAPPAPVTPVIEQIR